MNVIALRNGYVFNTIAKSNSHEIVQTDDKVVEFFKGILIKDRFNLSSFRNFVLEKIDLRFNYGREGSDLMKELENFL